MPDRKAAAVQFRNVTKRYGSVTAVDDISFDIAPATLVTLLGPSGCGKTTTLRMIAGLEIASEGAIFIGGIDVTRLSAADRNVSMVFQSYALFPHMSVIENVSYGPSVSGLPKAEARARAMEKIRLIGLDGLENRSPSELSGGQQQRVAVARALVLEPEVLLFDEPLSNLDAKLRRRVRDDIRELQQRLALTVVYVTHDQEEALAVSDRIIVMSNARIAQAGTPRELYEQPASRFVADFIGDSNIVDVDVAGENSENITVTVATLTLTLPRRPIPAGATKLAIRPQAINVHLTKPDEPSLKGEILKAAYLGDHVELTVRTEAGDLFAITRPKDDLVAGALVWLTLEARSVNLVPAGD